MTKNWYEYNFIIEIMPSSDYCAQSFAIETKLAVCCASSAEVSDHNGKTTKRKSVCFFKLSLGGQTVFFVKRKQIPQEAENRFEGSTTLFFDIFLLLWIPRTNS